MTLLRTRVVYSVRGELFEKSYKGLDFEKAISAKMWWSKHRWRDDFFMLYSNGMLVERIGGNHEH